MTDPAATASRSAAAGFDLRSAIGAALAEEGFVPSLDANAAAALAAALAEPPAAALARARAGGAEDLRALLWSSIDNVESRDLDQVEWAEQLDDDCIRVLVGIADVDLVVPCDSALDRHARANATSVYAGVAVFPMLPEEISAGRTSLLPGEERAAVVVELVVDAEGEVRRRGARRAIVVNRAKLAYEEVGRWLEGGEAPALFATVDGLEAQLRLQREAARRLKAERLRAGALEFETIEARPVAEDGRVVDLALVHKSLARDLIEDFMIASNVALARFLEDAGRSGIRRVVRAPERWSRIVQLAERFGDALPAEPDSRALAGFLARRRAADPEGYVDLSASVVKLLGPGQYALDRPGHDPGGHFGLAADDYTHATAPNRRYSDLVTQRLVKAALAGAPAPYADDALAEIAAHCTEREDASRKVERRARKSAAAVLLAPRVGEVFDAVVTGRKARDTYVRLLQPPAEGRVVARDEGMDVGDRVRVRLVAVDPERGFVDLEGTE